MKRILVSKCLLEFPYRYDGRDVRVHGLKELLEGYDVISVCPEVELLNLPVPRPRLKFLFREGELILVKEDTGERFEKILRERARDFLEKLGRIDLAVLKSKSPSCGIGDAKVYRCIKCEDWVGRTWGVFADEVRRMYPDIPLISEDEIAVLTDMLKPGG